MGKSSSDASTKTTTTYNTTSTTSIGDIGFTGKDAVAFETALLQYNLASQQSAQQTISNFTSQLSSFGVVPSAAPATQSDASEAPNATSINPLYLWGGIAVAIFLLLR